MFWVRHDDGKHRILAGRTGFFAVDAAPRYRAAIQQALARAGRAGAFDMLIDNSGGQPLSSEVSKLFECIAADIRASSARRIAFISPGAVNRIQAKRITQAETDPRFRMFEDAGCAEAWLDERP